MNVLFIFLGVFAAIIVLAIVYFVLASRKGKIEIIPEKFSYSAGETINGRVVLHLKKPIEANQLTMGLVGEMHTTTRTVNSTQSRNTQVFNFSYPVEGKKNFLPGDVEYKFTIQIPQNLQGAMPEGVLGGIVKAAQMLSNNASNVKWYLSAVLDASGIDLSKRIQINVA